MPQGKQSGGKKTPEDFCSNQIMNNAEVATLTKNSIFKTCHFQLYDMNKVTSK